MRRHCELATLTSEAEASGVRGFCISNGYVDGELPSGLPAPLVAARENVLELVQSRIAAWVGPAAKTTQREAVRKAALQILSHEMVFGDVWPVVSAVAPESGWEDEPEFLYGRLGCVTGATSAADIQTGCQRVGELLTLLLCGGLGAGSAF